MTVVLVLLAILLVAAFVLVVTVVVAVVVVVVVAAVAEGERAEAMELKMLVSSSHGEDQSLESPLNFLVVVAALGAHDHVQQGVGLDLAAPTPN